ncbi:Thioredoxin domain [Magnetococcus marinus MC-1]|uniref:Thioredoxin n=1 Tax=Magnetococcus marinus (strain ATCC BAA-1437 / JCM 17883 / MC-1) TaxID=156889 RepID=A0L915_MAGMM|nr:thioredoxin domain-containing protein [Magnetococcus marinus]ABK44458.1 Thioredoxin domain [Magnetococcus marinus MC-1]
MESLVADIIEEQFAADVIMATGMVLVKFWAPWCGNSRKMIPVYAAVAQQLQGKLRCVRLDIDHNPTPSRRYGIRGVPVFMLFSNGHIVDTRTGVMTEAECLVWLAGLMNV